MYNMFKQENVTQWYL